MIDTYRNGGKYSPRFSRRLCFCTERMPFQPMFHASFHKRRLSVSQSTRLAIFSKYIIAPRSPDSAGRIGRFLIKNSWQQKSLPV